MTSRRRAHARARDPQPEWRRRCALAAIALACARSTFPALAQDAPAVPPDECARILAGVASRRHASAGTLRCAPHLRSALYTVVAVHDRAPAPKGSDAAWLGSSLVGYYALDRGNGTVHEWDVGEDCARVADGHACRPGKDRP